MKVNITPTKLQGTIQPPTSKSVAHRLIIAAGLTAGVSRLAQFDLSQDIQATMDCMTALGAKFQGGEGMAWRVDGVVFGRGFDALPELDCGESGSTLRFLIPVALAVAGGGVFTGRGRLMERPQGPYETLLRSKDIRIDRRDDKMIVEGRLSSGEYALPGDVSSQFITGLLFALPLLEGNSVIRLTTSLESKGYVNLTLDVLHRAGIVINPIEGGWMIPGGQHYHLTNGVAEADYSQAAFYLVAKGLGNEVDVWGLNPYSAQGDKVILDYCRQLAQRGDVELDVSQCPDLVPPLAVYGALRPGQITRIVGAARLRMKESDRLDTVTTQLNRLGARIEQAADSLTIYGVESLRGGEVSGCGDHRIAMMLAIAATRAEGAVILDGAECVAKSYPHFWVDYGKLGGRMERMDA